MLSIGTKKYRNLQEQVGYNTECIKKLDEYLDGITLQDKLVIIANDSGTFTEKELETLSMPLAFIANASKVWMKEDETVSEIVYKAIDVVATEVGGAYFKIGGSKIVIDKATRAFAISDNDIVSTYSKSQLDTLLASKADASALTAGLALKADKAGQAFTGPITAPSIIEDMSGYSFSTSLTTLTYAGVVKNGNKITFAIYGSFTTSETHPGSGIYQLGTFAIPSSVGEKLIPDVNVIATGGISLVKNYFTTPTAGGYIVVKDTNTQIGFRLMTAGLATSTTYKLRYEVTFLLSDNLVS